MAEVKFFPASLVDKFWAKIKNLVSTSISALSSVYSPLGHAHAASEITVADSGNKLDATNVEAAIAEIIGMAEDIESGAAITVTSPTNADTGYLKTYVISQGNVEKGRINIPKDLVVTSGSCVKVANGKDKSDNSDVELANGTYLKLVIANQANPVYIPASSLVDIYTGGSTAEISVSVDSDTNVITATIVEISGSKLTDGTVTKTKLASGVQDSLDLADSAYQKPQTGIPSTDMASAVQTSLGKADTAYQKPGTGIPDTDMSSGVQTSLGKADSAYQKPGTGIPKTDLASGVQDSLDAADSAYQKPNTGIPSTDLASAVQTSLDKADTAVQPGDLVAMTEAELNAICV